jgi:hypothetical protein
MERKTQLALWESTGEICYRKLRQW